MADDRLGGPSAQTAVSVPLADTQAVLDELRAEGWTCEAIAQHSGVSLRTLGKIVNSQVRWVRGSTYEALTRLRPDEPLCALREMFDPGPLIAAIRAVGVEVVNPDADPKSRWLKSQERRWRECGGLLWWQADRWANRLHMHPADVWGDDWWAAATDGAA